MLDLAKLREKRAAGEKGFTLIELLVVVVIIGILIAIAIPVYLNYKKGASDKSAQSDLRNAINTLEQCNTDNAKYPASMTSAGVMIAGTTGCDGQSLKLSDGTVFSYVANTGATNYNLYAWNSKGSTATGSAYCYNSEKGGSIASGKTSSTTYSATACA